MRLTEKTDSGNWCLRDVPWDQLKPGVVLTQKTWEKLYGALWKLKDYEDSGKTPDEVIKLLDDIAELKEQVKNMYTYDQVQHAINLASEDGAQGYTDNIVSDYLP